jgi:hypothetical protein
VASSGATLARLERFANACRLSGGFDAHHLDMLFSTWYHLEQRWRSWNALRTHAAPVAVAVLMHVT